METNSTNPVPQHKLRKLWRKMRWLVLAMVVLVVLHFCWIKAEERQLARVVADLHNAGEPILPEDFDQKPVPDSENAVVDLRAAAASINDEE